MATLVVGDVHGCAEELARVLDVVHAERVVLVGDLYTKGPDPAGVWALIRDRGLEAVLGNHDQRLLDVLDGQRPGDRAGHACVERLDAADPAWRDHLRGLPLWREDVGGFTVVHAGVHPSGDLQRTTKGMAISMRRWPEGADEAPCWHEVYGGERRVIYGHDARRGLTWYERAGRPHVVGLDTGCVYGGVLTGLVVDDARLVQVPARAVYKAV